MRNFSDYILEKIINNLVITDGNSKYIKESSLYSFGFNDEEINFVKQNLLNNNIKFFPDEITVNSRSNKTDEYYYGEISSYELGYLDNAVLSDLEYNDDKELIYEDYSKLDEYLDNEFIPNYIRKKEFDNGKSVYYIKLKDLLSLKLNEVELKHTMNYFKKQDIIVTGTSLSLAGEFDNYKYVVMSSYRYDFPKSYVTSDIIMEKIALYKKNPSLELRNEIVLLNINLVKKVASLFKNVPFDLEELESFGYEGLIMAIEDFNIDLGYKFSTYAISKIRNGILRGITILNFNKSNSFYHYLSSAIRKIENNSQLLLRENLFLVDEVVELLVTTGKIDVKSKKDMRRKILLHFVDNLDNYIDKIGFEYTDDYIEYDDNLIEDNRLYLDITKNIVDEKLNETLASLSERDAKILVEHYGLDGNDPKTLKEIGIELGITKQRIQVLEKKIINKLKESYHVKYLKDFLEEYDQYNYEANPLIAYQSVKK